MKAPPRELSIAERLEQLRFWISTTHAKGLADYWTREYIRLGGNPIDIQRP